jgi:hypothetical protein
MVNTNHEGLRFARLPVLLGSEAGGISASSSPILFEDLTTDSYPKSLRAVL